MRSLIVLPTLDGSAKSAASRLEAWLVMPTQHEMVGDVLAGSSGWTLGDQHDRLDLLGVA